MLLTDILTSEQITAIQKHIDSKTHKIAWNNNGDTRKLYKKDLEAIIKSQSTNDVESSLYDENFDAICEFESNVINRAIEWITDSETLQLLRDNEVSINEFFSVCIDLNLTSVLESQNAVITMYSNYDCINSFWFMTQGLLYYKNTYFGACVDALNLNPKLVKQALNEIGVNCGGTWPNKSNRDTHEYVKIKDFVSEFQNLSSGGSLLQFTFKLDLTDLTGDKVKKVTLHKGTSVGFYNHSEGGGSMFDLQLQRDMTINLSKAGKTEFDHFELSFDKVLAYKAGYDIESCFGCDNMFEGKPAILHF